MFAQYGRLMADALTLVRVMMSVSLIWLGINGGAQSLPFTILILLIAWLTDVFDGILARRALSKEPSWIGKHEDIADMTMSLGVLGYLAFSGLISALITAILGFVILALWLYAYPLAWPFYAIPYVILMVYAFQNTPFYGWLMIAYLVIALVMRGPRLLREYLPLLMHTLRHPRQKR